MALWACTAGPADDTAAASAPFTAGSSETAEATYTPEELELEVQAVLDDLLAWNARALFERYDSWMAGSDDSCPTWAIREQDSTWTAACTAESGSSYLGTSTEREDSYTEDGYDVTIREVETSAEFSDGAGASLVLDGTLTEEVRVYDGHTIYQSRVDGRFYDSDGAAWLADAPLANFGLHLRSGKSAQLVQASGSLGARSGDLSAVWIDDLIMGDHVACPVEGSGSIALKDTSGHWYAMTFDGDDQTGDVLAADDPGCDGCAQVSYAGAVIGEVCVDLTGLVTSWEASPW